MNILFYVNVVALAFNLARGVGQAVLGSPNWWASMVMAAISGFCVWYLNRARKEEAGCS